MPTLTHPVGGLRRPPLSVLTWMVLGVAMAGAAQPGEVVVDGGRVVESYRDAIAFYRRHDPATLQAGRVLVARAAAWDLDMARMAAKLAAMPPPQADTIVRLDDGDDTRSARDANWARLVARSYAIPGGLGNPYATANEQVGSRLVIEDRLASAFSSDRGERLTARVAAEPPSPGNSERATIGRGACLIDMSSEGCARALMAAALLHTDAATTELARGDRNRAAVHHSTAGWLLWHLPKDARNDALVRDWLLAVTDLLRREGSLSSARRIGRLGLERFPGDEALRLSTARATEALAALCYENDDAPFPHEDCVERTFAFDGPSPSPLSPPSRQRPNRKAAIREAERMLRDLAKEQPARAEIHLRLGHTLAMRGETRDAERELRWVLANATESRDVALARLLLSRVAESQGSVEDAVAHARAAVAAAPGSQAARMALAHALLVSGDQDTARSVLDLPQAPPAEDGPWNELLMGSSASYAAARAALYAQVQLR